VKERAGVLKQAEGRVPVAEVIRKAGISEQMSLALRYFQRKYIRDNI